MHVGGGDAGLGREDRRRAVQVIAGGLWVADLEQRPGMTVILAPQLQQRQAITE